MSASDRVTARPPPPKAGRYTTELCAGAEGMIAIYRFRRAPAGGRRRLIVLKLDHFGDFVIGLPALKRLRALFAGDHITLVCGAWNEALARQAVIADEIRTYGFFPENGALWTGESAEGLARFREVCRGRFDLALDLRVDEDTRFLLEHIDAALRGGIGARARQPFLDIVLPPEFEARESEYRPLLLTPERFQSQMPVRTAFVHETDFRRGGGHIVFGPYVPLPEGRFRATWGLQLSAPLGCFAVPRIVLDVARLERFDSVAVGSLKWRGAAGPAAEIVFANPEPGSRFEFRIHARGRPPGARLRFFGVRVEPLADTETARQKRAELHVGEQLALLVELVRQRLDALYPAPVLTGTLRPGPAAAALAAAGAARRIVIAALSNSETRDWGLERYARLAALLLERTGCQVVLVGAREQRQRLDRIVAASGGGQRIANLAGLTGWAETAAIISAADLVICNNSGVAHLAAAGGTPTLAIYSGTHQPQEWGPRGERVEVVTALVSCSPCGHEKLALCPHEHRCMRLIEPALVAERALALLAERADAARPPERIWRSSA